MLSTADKIDRISFRILLLRISVIISLVVVSTLFGALSYTFVEEIEERNYRDQYDSIANKIQEHARKSLQNAQLVGEELAIIAGLTHNNASQWPNSSIIGFQHISEKLQTLSQFQAISLLPIVSPEEISNFETYAQRTFTEDPSYPPESGESAESGFGVYKIDSITGDRMLDRSGLTDFSPFSILTPILNVFPIQNQSNSLLYNVHSEKTSGVAIDDMINCINQKENSLRVSSLCTTLTETVFSRDTQDFEPLTFMFFPIFPFLQPDLVGFTRVTYPWLGVFQGAVPDFVSGIDCVLCSSECCFTFSITEGEPKFRGAGDFHDTNFDYLSRSFDIYFDEDSAPKSAKFEIFVHARGEFYDIYHTDLPLYCLVAVILTIMTSIAIVFTYHGLSSCDKSFIILEFKRLFVRYVSHEIRTPLNTVNVGLNVLEDFFNELPQEEESQIAKVEELRLLTNEIKAGAETAVMVVSDFLQYDKIENSSLVVDLTLLIPVDFVRHAAKMFLPISKAYKISLSFQFNGLYDSECAEMIDSKLRILADRNRMAQVIRNLISKALKFSPEGSEVIVSCSYKPNGLPEYEHKNSEFQNCECVGSLLISVEDSGPGISHENQKKLFGEGMQFNLKDLQGGQGSGLGLWICKAIVELHGGLIWAESDGEGRGTTFFIELPILKEVLSPKCDEKKIRKSFFVMSGRVAPFESLDSVTGKSFDSVIFFKRILIVDDAPSNRKMLSRLLQIRGYQCDAVEDGVDCVRIMENEAMNGTCSYDCILLDYQMIHMNGPETAAYVRKLGFLSDRVKIIGVTGNVMKEDVDNFLNNGANFVMQKPFNFEIFENEMKRFCGFN